MVIPAVLGCSWCCACIVDVLSVRMMMMDNGITQPLRLTLDGSYQVLHDVTTGIDYHVRWTVVPGACMTTIRQSVGTKWVPRWCVVTVMGVSSCLASWGRIQKLGWRLWLLFSMLPVSLKWCIVPIDVVKVVVVLVSRGSENLTVILLARLEGFLARIDRATHIVYQTCTLSWLLGSNMV
jgi:hypothetical protein